MYNYLARNMFIPVLDFFRGVEISQYLRELEKSQWFTREKLREIQQKNLRLLIQHLYENTPYYYRVMKKLGLKPAEIKSVEDLRKLPILTKADIRRNFDDLIATIYPEKKRVLYTTGGSTGEPLKFYVNKKQHSCETAAMLRACTWCGYNLGDKIALLWGSPITYQSQKKYIIKQ